MEGKAAGIRFFHVCTDGSDNGIVYYNEKDYRQAIIIASVLAYRMGVRIICFCHMSTHSHFVIWCETREQAKDFIDSFKRDYSRYLYLDRKIHCSYRRIGSAPKEIEDFRYLKNCISYVLLNPVAAGIVSSPENYAWSSFEAYFNTAPSPGRPILSVGVREQHRLLKTWQDLSSSGFIIDDNGIPALKSYIDYSLVERLFGNRTNFYKSLALTDNLTEEMKYVRKLARFSDDELWAEAVAFAKKLFNVSELQTLTFNEKLKVGDRVMKKTGVPIKRIARILRINPEQF